MGGSKGRKKNCSGCKGHHRSPRGPNLCPYLPKSPKQSESGDTTPPGTPESEPGDMDPIPKDNKEYIPYLQDRIKTSKMFTLYRTMKCQVSSRDKGKYLAEYGERQNGQGDLTITVGSRSTKVHRSVLMDTSDYFKTMFTGGFSEADATTLDLSHIFEDLDELNAVLDYLYTRSISLSEENITSVTNSACFLLLADLQDACSDFLTANLSPSTCINIFVLSERHNTDKLQGACLEVIKAWFPFGLCHSPEALDLSPSCLCVLVKAGVLAMLSNADPRIFCFKKRANLL